MIIGILRLLIALVGLSLFIVKVKAKDWHTALYWALATTYWTLTFIEFLAKS